MAIMRAAAASGDVEDTAVQCAQGGENREFVGGQQKHESFFADKVSVCRECRIPGCFLKFSSCLMVNNMRNS